MARTALVVTTAAAALLLVGCGDSATSTVATSTVATSTVPAAAPAVCTKAALLQQLRGASPGSSASIRALRCAPRHALARVSQGETRATILWEGRSGRWIEIERVEPGVCSAQAAAHGLCTRSAPDPALRGCSARAFVAALREDVDQLQFVVDRARCRGDFASTRYTVGDCLPEQTERRRACERTRVAAWRRGATRWHLITYSTELDCATIRAAAPRFPAELCR